MRTLTLCLILMAGANAQDSVYIGSLVRFMPRQAPVIDLFKADSNRRITLNADALSNTLLDLYAQYESECLRDTVIDSDHVELSRSGRIWHTMSSAKIDELNNAFGTNYVDNLYPYIRPAWIPRVTPNGLDSHFINWLRRK